MQKTLLIGMMIFLVLAALVRADNTLTFPDTNSGSGTVTDPLGMAIHVNAAGKAITWVSTQASVDCNQIVVYDNTTHELLGSASLSLYNASFSPILSIPAIHDYFVLAHNADNTSCHYRYHDPAGFPVAGTDITGLFSITNYNWGSDVVLYDIKAIGTTDMPAAASTNTTLWLNNTQGNLTGVYGQTVNATATTNITELYVSIFRNSTLVANATTVSSYVDTLGAGAYIFNATTLGNASFNPSTASWYATITKATPTCILSYNPSSPITYNASFKAMCTCSNPKGTVKLYRNGTDVTAENNTNVNLGASTYAYICNETSSENYTSATTTSNFIVSKATPSYYISFVPNSSSVAWGTIVLVSCIYDSTPAEVLATAGFYNDTSVTDASYYFNSTAIDGGTFNFICNSSASQNYTAYSVNKSLIIIVHILVPVPVHVCFNIGNTANCFDYNTTDISTFSTKSQIFCSDNDTLAESITLLDKGNTSTALHYIGCPNGCDSITNTCAPLEWQTNLIGFGCIFAIIIVFGLAYRRRHRHG